MRRNVGRKGAGIILPLCLLWIGLLSVPLDVQAGSWLIDPAKFHASVHGQTSCQDCHEGIRDKAFHPHPEDITRKRADFFDVQHCLACHDDVLDKLEEGVHGSKKVDRGERYRACLDCHDPHTQTPINEEKGRFEPSRPRQEQCGVCHAEQEVLPRLSAEDDACMSCHRLGSPDDPRGAEKMQTLCFHCHGRSDTKAQTLTSGQVSPINRLEYAATPHARMPCTECHPQAVEFDHANQKARSCLACHPRHDEKVIHDAHLKVSCEACHLGGVQPFRDKPSHKILWKRETHVGSTSRVHHVLSRFDERSCTLCHRRDNTLGAASVILPPKSVLCMPCHVATFSVGDTTTIISLLLFLAGMGLFFSYVLAGTSAGRGDPGFVGKFVHLLGDGLRTIFSRKAFPIMQALLLDVILQRRLYRRSPGRWAIHALIFYPFLFRFVWGVAALLGSLWIPDWRGVWVMLDKNHPLGGFLFDLTGVILFLGILLAFLRGTLGKPSPPSGVPGQDRIALGLIGAVVLVGFLLEGMRIAMTGYPVGAGYSFLGYGVSRLFAEPSPGLTGIYGYVWYLHAVLTGLFIAYLPFSRLLHIILAPVVLAMNAVAEGAEGQRHEGTKG